MNLLRLTSYRFDYRQPVHNQYEQIFPLRKFALPQALMMCLISTAFLKDAMGLHLRNTGQICRYKIRFVSLSGTYLERRLSGEICKNELFETMENQSRTKSFARFHIIILCLLPSHTMLMFRRWHLKFTLYNLPDDSA